MNVHLLNAVIGENAFPENWVLVIEPPWGLLGPSVLRVASHPSPAAVARWRVNHCSNGWVAAGPLSF